MARLKVIMKLMKDRKDHSDKLHIEQMERVYIERLKGKEAERDLVKYEYIKGNKKFGYNPRRPTARIL